MYPLLAKDGLRFIYAVLLLCYHQLCGICGLLELVPLAIIHLFYALFVPPEKYPDVSVLVLSAASFSFFLGLYLWLHLELFTRQQKLDKKLE